MILIIKNAKLFNSTNKYEGTNDILIEDGKIKEIASKIEGDYENVIDAENKFVTPGLIEPHCAVGVQEQIYNAGFDMNEKTNPITPELRAIDAINPADEGFKKALEAGVTTLITGPGNTNLIGGTFAAVKPVGDAVEDMSIEDEIAFKFSLGLEPKKEYGSKGGPQTRLANASMIREILYKAKEYRDKDEKKFDLKLESLSRVFDGMPVKIAAQETQDIITGIRIAEEFDLDYTIDQCVESYLIPDYLKKHETALVLGPTYSGKRTHDLRNQELVSGKILEDQDIEFALSCGHPTMVIDLLRVQPIMMIKKGLSREAALKSITINSAKSVGLEDRIGSIEPGKDADIVIWSGDIFDYYSDADYVIIDGQIAHQR